MLQQLQSNRIEKLEHQLNQANSVIRELLGALTCESEEIRMLIRDVALEYINEIK